MKKQRASKTAGAGGHWQLQDAKAQFSLLFSRAVDQKKPQSVSRRGKDRAIVVDAQEYERAMRPSGTLVSFFMESPLREAGLELERIEDTVREVEF